MYRRRDANLRVDKLTAMVKASQIRSPNNGASDGIVTFASFTCQPRDTPMGRRQGNQWLGEPHG